jgi:hypothetical protein
VTYAPTGAARRTVTRTITLLDITLRLDPVLTARSLMGGVVEVVADWINGDITASVEELVEHFTQLFTATTNAAVVRPAPGAGRSSR